MFWQVSNTTASIYQIHLKGGKAGKGYITYMHTNYLSMIVSTKGYQKIIPHSTVHRVNTINKGRGKYQFVKKIILELGFRIYLLGYLEKQLIK